MTAVELRMSLLQEVALILDDEKAVRKTLAYLRKVKENAHAVRKPSPVADEDKEPTKEEILASIKEGLQSIKDRREGKDVTGMFMDVKDFLDEL